MTIVDNYKDEIFIARFLNRIYITDHFNILCFLFNMTGMAMSLTRYFDQLDLR